VALNAVAARRSRSMRVDPAGIAGELIRSRLR
jgi:hypothetical protein